ncbi:MAG TPA: hypothetical protein VKE40_03600 [Gemmataceae bacterium]|nr:hypothetical protein [Gemmataceae bacterium]
MSWRGAVASVLIALAGCRPAAEVPAGTGAKEAGHAFFEALSRQDWPASYALLTPESRARVGADEFARMAQAYRRSLGFETTEVHVTACDERGPNAIAHVTLSGQSPHRQRFKDAIALRRGDAGWSVILPANFGQSGAAR